MVSVPRVFAAVGLVVLAAVFALHRSQPWVEAPAPPSPVPEAAPEDTVVEVFRSGEGGLEGRVIDPEGRAVAGATLRLFVRDAIGFDDADPLFSGLLDHGLCLDTGRETVSDAEGRYRFEGLPRRADYHLVGTHPSFAETRVTVPLMYDAKLDHVLDVVLERGIRVHGSVFHDGAPLTGARVALWDTLANSFKPKERKQPFAVTHTDAQGRYEFEHVHFSACEVVASNDGFATLTRSKHTLYQPVGDVELDFELPRAVDLRGRVVDTRGGPIAGAELTVLQVGWPVDQGGAKGSALSIHDGSFRISGLAQGHYEISASAAGFSDVNIGTFETEGEEILIEMEARGCATGTVTAADGARVDSFSLRAMILRGEGEPVPTRVTQVYERTNGHFSLCDLDPGRYVLQASADGYADTRSEPFSVERGQTVQNVSIILTQGATVTGVVVDDQGQPMAGAEVKLNQNNFVDNPFHAIFAAMVPKGQRMVPRRTRTADDGSFTLALVLPGIYQLAIRHQGFATHAQNDLRLEDGHTHVVGRLALSRGGTITGRCFDFDGRPYASGTVNCTGSNGTGFQTVRPDLDGHFEIVNLQPGQYTLTLNPGDGVNGEPIDPIRKVIQAQKTEQVVDVTSDRTVEVQLTLPPLTND